MVKSSKLNLIISLSVLILIIYFIYYYYDSSYSTTNLSLRISVNEARSRRFGLIIDVRTPKERELLGYYPNSIPNMKLISS